MIQLAHVSDVHLTAPDWDWTRADWFNKRLAAWFNFRWLGRRLRFRQADEVLQRWQAEIRERKIDHVIFSGDATALGFPSEISKAADMLGVGRLPGLAVPGNHDYCTRPAAASGNFERAFAAWQDGLRVDENVYPFAQTVGTVWLVAVNSSTGNRWAWDAGGAVGPEQRQRLARLLEKLEGGPRILVTHFPVCLACGKLERRSHGLRDLPELVDVAAKGGISLWLHGHRHSHYRLQESPHAPFPIICAGSSTQTRLWSYGEYTIDGWRLQGLRRCYNPAS
jgi:3',5'-cyclic AMP phosphodiesterase CpdA